MARRQDARAAKAPYARAAAAHFPLHRGAISTPGAPSGTGMLASARACPAVGTSHAAAAAARPTAAACGAAAARRPRQPGGAASARPAAAPRGAAAARRPRQPGGAAVRRDAVAAAGGAHIAVIGGGVAGLTTALRVLLELPGACVTVIADAFGGDVTSAGAAGGAGRGWGGRRRGRAGSARWERAGAGAQVCCLPRRPRPRRLLPPPRLLGALQAERHATRPDSPVGCAARGAVATGTGGSRARRATGSAAGRADAELRRAPGPE
jgi:hypothetical protein